MLFRYQRDPLTPVAWERRQQMGWEGKGGGREVGARKQGAFTGQCDRQWPTVKQESSFLTNSQNCFISLISSYSTFLIQVSLSSGFLLFCLLVPVYSRVYHTNHTSSKYTGATKCLHMKLFTVTPHPQILAQHTKGLARGSEGFIII